MVFAPWALSSLDLVRFSLALDLSNVARERVRAQRIPRKVAAIGTLTYGGRTDGALRWHPYRAIL